MYGNFFYTVCTEGTSLSLLHMAFSSAFHTRFYSCSCNGSSRKYPKSSALTYFFHLIISYKQNRWASFTWISIIQILSLTQEFQMREIYYISAILFEFIIYSKWFQDLHFIHYYLPFFFQLHLFSNSGTVTLLSKNLQCFCKLCCFFLNLDIGNHSM